MRLKTALLLPLAMLATCSLAMGSITLGFKAITNNTIGDPGIAETQLFVEVYDAGGGTVAFRFYNNGPYASSITDVYFDDGTLLGISGITNGSGVNFTENATPKNLPSGSNVSFVTGTAILNGGSYSADSTPPTQPNGVNPGEEVTIFFQLVQGKTYADTLAALNDDSLRIGIHVQGFESGGSESLIDNPIPAPAAVALGLIGIGMLGLFKRRTA